MDVSIWIVILLVLLSGVIAAVGDWLGRRLGKKRLRLGRMRPRNTAIATTFIAGMLITLLTVLVLSLVSEQVRVWLTEGTDVQRKLRDTQGELDDTQKQLRQGRQQLSSVSAELETERQKLAAEQAKVVQATRDANEMRTEAAELRAQVNALGQNLRKSADELKHLQAQRSTLESQVNTLQINIDEYHRQQDELFRQNNELLRLNEQYSQEIDGLEAQIGNLNAQVIATQAAQEQATRAFEEQRKQIEADRQQALKDLEAAETALRKARQDLADIQRVASALSNETTIARLNPLIYSRGDELSRLAVRSGLTQGEARTYLLAVIAAASRDAMGRGAVESPTSSSAAAFGAFNTQDGTPLTPEIQFNQALQQIAAKETELVIVARAIVNAFKGEWVRIAIDVRPNPVVYRAGDFIIETRIDGRRGVQACTEALIGFMSTQLRERAVSDGMIPAIGRATELGAISQEEVQRIVGDIVDTGRTITVRFHAAVDTKAGDQLALDVRLR